MLSEIQIFVKSLLIQRKDSWHFDYSHFIYWLNAVYNLSKTNTPN